MPIQSCFVFDCTNPAAPVPVGRFDLDELKNGRFAYCERYLQASTAFALDPIHLPLQHSEIAIKRGGDEAFGVFTDAAPSAWGANLTLKLRRDGNQHIPRNVVEWFLSSQLVGSGCLGFSSDQQTPPQIEVDIQTSRALTAKALQGIESYTVAPTAKFDAETERLISPGSGLGGMRPKTLVMHGGTEHIVKFGRPDDVIDVPAAEYATLRLATRAGIDVPSFELIDVDAKSALLIERFDRSNGKHIHYASAQSFLDPQPLSPDGREFLTHFSYAGIAEILRAIRADARADVHELFRRMVMNIMVGNVDDHLRNHGFLMLEPGLYSLSPAFDIVPHLEAPSRPQSIGVGKFGPASTIANVLSQCERFLLTETEAREIVSEVKDIASTWRSEFRQAGISQREISALADCFNVADQADNVQISAKFPGLTQDIASEEKILARCDELGISPKRAQRFAEATENQESLAAILGLDPTTLAPLRNRPWLRMAAQSASVSYRLALSEEQLLDALVTGRIEAGYSAHFCTLFDEVPYQISLMAVFQAAKAKGIPTPIIWRNVEYFATSVGAHHMDLWRCDS